MTHDDLRRKLYERVAGRYHSHAQSHRAIAKKLAEYSGAYLTPGGCGVDVAGGLAYASYYFAQMHDVSCINTDSSLAMCRQSGAGMSICADMTALPFKRNAFDIALCSMALHWAQDMTQALKEMREIARFVAVAVPVDGSLAALYRAMPPSLRRFEFPTAEYVMECADKADLALMHNVTEETPVVFADARDALLKLRAWGGNNPEGAANRYAGKAALKDFADNVGNAPLRDNWRYKGEF